MDRLAGHRRSGHHICSPTRARAIGTMRKGNRTEGRLQGIYVRRFRALEPTADETAGHVLWQEK
ncbi:hypothetical protein GCM10009811_16510 [Nostocoides veronense]|uniref:Uncharacterized protein n=1 Tax=Nostocoides veronense TaxID=330836 RepID=A0ABP4XXE2_9MICO